MKEHLLSLSAVGVLLAAMFVGCGGASEDLGTPGGRVGQGQAGMTGGMGGAGGIAGGVAGGTGGVVGGTGGEVGGTGGVVGGTGGVVGGPATYETCVQDAKDRGKYDDCADCTCQQCLPELELCYNSDDTAKNDLCVAVIDCGLAAGCVSTQCYCGTVEPLPCGLGLPPPNGACIAEIDAASGTTGAINVKAVKDGTDTTNPMVRAYQLSLCAQGDPLPTDALGTYLTPIPGKCDHVCN